MTKKAFQDYYPDYFSHCWGYGRLNEYGVQIKSYWDGEETVCIHEPPITSQPFHSLSDSFSNSKK